MQRNRKIYNPQPEVKVINRNVPRYNRDNEINRQFNSYYKHYKYILGYKENQEYWKIQKRFKDNSRDYDI